MGGLQPRPRKHEQSEQYRAMMGAQKGWKKGKSVCECAFDARKYENNGKRTVQNCTGCSLHRAWMQRRRKTL